MVQIRRNARATSSRTLFAVLVALIARVAVAADDSGVSTAVSPSGQFLPVYALLSEHCGACHVQGVADGPWSLNTPPTLDRFPECLALSESDQLSCATYHQLVDEPAPGIPAWIRPREAASSEPYVQACDSTVSFHIGHSLPAALQDEDCAFLLHWIENGAAFR